MEDDAAPVATIHNVMNSAALRIPDLSGHDHPRPDHVNLRAASISSET